MQSVSTPRQLFRQVQFGGRTWTLRMRPLPVFEDRYEYETHHISALLGGAQHRTGLVCVVAGHRPHPGRRRFAYRMTAELRGTRDELASTSTPFPIC